MTITPTQAPCQPDIRSVLDAGEESFDTWAELVRHRTDGMLRICLPVSGDCPARLHEAMRYSALSGGKRIRPLLCQAAGRVVDAPCAVLDMVGAAVEMIHVFTLVHDDLPAMDDDILRHGQPTVHVRYDEGTAILVGDALQAQAFLTLSSVALPAERRVALIHELACACGSSGLAGGQAIDLMSAGLRLDPVELERMDRMKTGTLIRAAVCMGALCGVTDDTRNTLAYQALDDYASALGLAFQVVDDMLDVTASSAALGKTAGKDGDACKPTWVSTIGLDASRALAQQLHDRSLAALEPLGARAAYLRNLADRVVDRVY